MTVTAKPQGRVLVVTIDRPESRNADETRHGLSTIATGETQAGASRFAGGAGRHGEGV